MHHIFNAESILRPFRKTINTSVNISRAPLLLCCMLLLLAIRIACCDFTRYLQWERSFEIAHCHRLLWRSNNAVLSPSRDRGQVRGPRVCHRSVIWQRCMRSADWENLRCVWLTVLFRNVDSAVGGVHARENICTYIRNEDRDILGNMAFLIS